MRDPFRWPNDIEFSGERKRVRCNEGLDAAAREGEPRRKEIQAWDDEEPSEGQRKGQEEL